MQKGGREIRKASVLYVTHRTEPLLCDFCDNKRQVACLKTLGKDTMAICRECIQDIQGLFGKDL